VLWWFEGEAVCWSDGGGGVYLVSGDVGPGDDEGGFAAKIPPPVDTPALKGGWVTEALTGRNPPTGLFFRLRTNCEAKSYSWRKIREF